MCKLFECIKGTTNKENSEDSLDSSQLLVQDCIILLKQILFLLNRNLQQKI